MKVTFCFRVGDNVFNNSLLEERFRLPRKNVFFSAGISFRWLCIWILL